MTLGKAVAEIEEGLKSLLMKVKESEKADLQLIIQKTKIIASGPITAWQIDGKTVETLSAFIFLVVSFTSCLQSFPASGSFPKSQFFTSGGQSIGVSALASVLPKNTQDQSPLEWTGWISLQSKGLSEVFSNTTVQKHQFFGAQPSSQSNSHIHT